MNFPLQSAKKVLVIVHQASSDPGLVGQTLTDFGYELDLRRPCLGEALPTTLDRHEAVIIFGGPMSANDSETLPFIRTELDWIPTALSSEKPFLGICLGAQMLARVLGATVKPHPDRLVEIGFFPLVPIGSLQQEFGTLEYVYHWHKEGFDLPAGAHLLAQGETFPNQAFRYGSTAYGVQFHPEMTWDILNRWTTQAPEMLVLPGAQSREQLKNYTLYAEVCKVWLQGFLFQWLLKTPAKVY